jgi:cytochrome c oxidase assembly protein subunit 15
MIPPEGRRAARRAGAGFGALAGAAFGLIVLGAIVRAHNAGLACPDWPLCFGWVVPAFDFKVALEWGHRALAGAVSLGLIAASLPVLRAPALRARAGAALAIVWALLCVQVVLGGLTVLLGLAPWTVTAHLLVGHAFFAALAWVASDLLAAARPAEPVPALAPAVTAAALACAALLGVQLALGGLVSSHYAGLACAHFPTCDGSSVAPSLSGLVGLHVAHRFGAYALSAAVVAFFWLARRDPACAGPARLALRLVLVQLVIGVANVLLRLPVEVTALHSALAAALTLAITAGARGALRAHAPDRSATASAEAAWGVS